MVERKRVNLNKKIQFLVSHFEEKRSQKNKLRVYIK